MAAKRRVSERTAALLEKQRQLEEQIKRSRQRDRSASKKIRNRALLLIGVACEQEIEQRPAHLQAIRRLSIEHLREREQEAVIEFLDGLRAATATATPPPMPTQDQSQGQENTDA